ncbi:17095_t:CDS:2 [Funneliformis geosporum]|uniref:17095_t:CDS:1 n=1 Tax=Funneliformis geosporum TaxID=1117311 RepID=A0A9W4SBC3_9GLOM|nr:17095_t:CDS:2 [Funneliformis geosporum]
MAVCTGREIDLKNDVFTVIEALDSGIFTFSCYSLLWKHTDFEASTRMTIWDGRDGNDDFFIRRYNSNTYNDESGYLSNGDIISLLHVLSGTALYSHPVLLDDGTQQVSCHGNGNDENKVRIELIDDSKFLKKYS